MPKYRFNPQTQQDDIYLTLKESFRDPAGRVQTRLLLTVGFLPELKPEEVRDIAVGLTYKYNHRNDPPTLFDTNKIENFSTIVREYIERFW